MSVQYQHCGMIVRHASYYGPGSFTMSQYIIVATHGLIILFTLLLYNVPFCARYVVVQAEVQ